MPTIVTEFGDIELVNLVLFKLPWLCHGLKDGLKVGVSGAVSVKRTSLLGSSQRHVLDLGSAAGSSLKAAS